jgi:hypothetical protein
VKVNPEPLNVEPVNGYNLGDRQMDFLLTKEQKFIQKAAREFALGEMAPVGREFDLNETYPEDIV